jgi:hypothetical protein
MSRSLIFVSFVGDDQNSAAGRTHVATRKVVLRCGFQFNLGMLTGTIPFLLPIPSQSLGCPSIHKINAKSEVNGCLVLVTQWLCRDSVALLPAISNAVNGLKAELSVRRILGTVRIRAVEPSAVRRV